MPDDTCFKFLKADIAWENIRSYLGAFGKLYQLYRPKDSPNNVYVKYLHANSAKKAWLALTKDPRAINLETMDYWPFKKHKPMLSSQNSPSASGTENYSQASLLSPPMVCCKCRRTNVEFMCGVCSTWYCNEQCQLLDWEIHKANCIPRLVRGFSVLYSKQNLNQQQMALQLAQQQQQQQQIQQKCKDPLPKEMESGQNGEKHRQPGGSEVHVRSRGVQQKPKQTPKPNAVAANSDKAKEPEPPVDILDAQDAVKPAAQQTKQRLLSEKSLAKEQQKSKEAASPQALPSNLENQQLKKPSSQQAQPSDASLENGREKPVAQQPDAAVKVPEDAPNTHQGPSVHVRMRNLALAKSKRTIANAAFPKVGSTVAISFVAERTLFIHEASDDLSDSFSRFINQSIQHASEIKESLQQPPTVGDIVFAPFSGLDYRAIVQKIDGGMVDVKFPDYGNTQRVDWKVMKEVKDTDIKYAPCLAHEVSLAGEVPFSPAVHAMLTDLVEEQTFEITQIQAAETPSGVPKVELRNVETKHLLSSEIRKVTANEAKTKQPPATLAVNVPKLEFPDPATYKPVSGDEFKDLSLPQDKSEPVEFTIVEAADFRHNHLVSVIMTSNQRAFAKILKECENYGQVDPNEYSGESTDYGCLVKYDETWCRAVKDTQTTAGSFYLLDLAVLCSPEKIDTVRRYPPALSRDMHCAECLVDNPEMLQELVKGDINSADALRGLCVKAKLRLDDAEVYHLQILSVLT